MYFYNNTACGTYIVVPQDKLKKKKEKKKTFDISNKKKIHYKSSLPQKKISWPRCKTTTTTTNCIMINMPWSLKKRKKKLKLNI